MWIPLTGRPVRSLYFFRYDGHVNDQPSYHITYTFESVKPTGIYKPSGKPCKLLSGALATTPLGTFTQGAGHANHTKKPTGT